MTKKVRVLLLIMSLSLTLSIMSNTYSRYIAGATGNVEVAFSKWQIMVNNNDITSNANSTIELIPILDANNNIKSQTIAPSSKGHFDIDIDPTNVGVSFNYTIDLSVKNENMPDLMITKYAVIDNDYINEDKITYNTLYSNQITGSLDYNNSEYKAFTIRVYFEWYEGAGESMNDAADTLIATSTDVTPSLNIEAKISFEQKISAVTATM